MHAGSLLGLGLGLNKGSGFKADGSKMFSGYPRPTLAALKARKRPFRDHCPHESDSLGGVS